MQQNTLLIPPTCESVDVIKDQVKLIVRYIFSRPNYQKAFLDASRQDIIYDTILHVKAGTFSVLYDQRYVICGVVFFAPDDSARILHVQQILSDFPEAMVGFAFCWSINFPGWRVSAMRRGVRREYDYATFTRRYKNKFSLED